jgi:hypothetical protein
MILVRLLAVRVPRSDGAFSETKLDKRVWIDAGAVDTITELSTDDLVQQHLPMDARTGIRYRDAVTGYRLFFVADEPDHVARVRERLLRGEDPREPEFSFISPD